MSYCEMCRRTFKNKKGLAIHIHKMHKFLESTFQQPSPTQYQSNLPPHLQPTPPSPSSPQHLQPYLSPSPEYLEPALPCSPSPEYLEPHRKSFQVDMTNFAAGQVQQFAVPKTPQPYFPAPNTAEFYLTDPGNKDELMDPFGEI